MNIFLYLFIKFYLLLAFFGITRLPKIKGLFGLIYDRFKNKKGLIAVRTNNYKMYVDLSDLIISKKLIQYGYWEKGVTDLFKKIIKSGMIIVDVGAHVGYYSLFFSKYTGKSGKVFAFEPDSYNFKIFRKNILLNKINNIVAENMAVSDKNGYARLFLDENNLGAHSLISSESSDNYINIKSAKLDDYFKEIKIDLIKMDIEGAEARAIEGMSEILRRNPNIKLIMEFFPELILKAGYSPEAMIEKLLSFGFHIFMIGHQTGILTEAFGAREILDACGNGLVNLLCVKNNQIAL